MNDQLKELLSKAERMIETCPERSSEVTAVALGVTVIALLERVAVSLERIASSIGDDGVLRMRDVDRAKVYEKHLGEKLR